MQVGVTVNDREYVREIEPRLLLVHFLRDELRLTGTHWGCDTSNCGTCVVLMDGEPVKSCTLLAATAAGHRDPDRRGARGRRRARSGAGRLQSRARPAVRLLHLGDDADRAGAARRAGREAPLTDDEIREAISGQICRCTGYATIVRSIRWAAEHPTGGEMNMKSRCAMTAVAALAGWKVGLVLGVVVIADRGGDRD